MSGSDLSSESKFRLADRLPAARQGRFVGREAELQLLRSTLLAAELPFAVGSRALTSAHELGGLISQAISLAN